MRVLPYNMSLLLGVDIKIIVEVIVNYLLSLKDNRDPQTQPVNSEIYAEIYAHLVYNLQTDNDEKGKREEMENIVHIVADLMLPWVESLYYEDMQLYKGTTEEYNFLLWMLQVIFQNEHKWKLIKSSDWIEEKKKEKNMRCPEY